MDADFDLCLGMQATWIAARPFYRFTLPHHWKANSDGFFTWKLFTILELVFMSYVRKYAAPLQAYNFWLPHLLCIFASTFIWGSELSSELNRSGGFSWVLTSVSTTRWIENCRTLLPVFSCLEIISLPKFVCSFDLKDDSLAMLMCTYNFVWSGNESLATGIQWRKYKTTKIRTGVIFHSAAHAQFFTDNRRSAWGLVAGTATSYFIWYCSYWEDEMKGVSRLMTWKEVGLGFSSVATVFWELISRVLKYAMRWG